jgi:hypothetical protein
MTFVFLPFLHQSTESVRNFLIDKLKAAEMEIRNLMTSSSALKKQSVSDQEVCRGCIPYVRCVCYRVIGGGVHALRRYMQINAAAALHCRPPHRFCLHFRAVLIIILLKLPFCLSSRSSGSWTCEWANWKDRGRRSPRAVSSYRPRWTCNAAHTPTG